MAVIADGQVASLVISSQAEHEDWGGVVPELASRAHLKSIGPIVRRALEKASVETPQLSAIAATTEPGLVGSLLVGLNVAKGMALRLRVPLVGVHHIEAHLLSIMLDEPDVEFPYVGLVVSGGHTLLYDVRGIGEYRLIGATRDDAAGEAFDKGAKLLGLGYPGGPKIDELARDGDPQRHDFPRSLLRGDSDDFSFSGLKTSLRYFLRDNYPNEPPKNAELADICASYQEAIVETLVRKAIGVARRLDRKRIVVVGGVAVNSRMRTMFPAECARSGMSYHTVKPIYSTDNAAMIGLVGWQRYVHGMYSPLTITARASMIRSDRGKKGRRIRGGGERSAAEDLMTRREESGR